MEKNSKDKYAFDVNNFEFIKNIKQGGFGIIKLVRDKNTKEEYAAKTNFIQIKAENKHFITREIRILIRIQHPTIIKFRGYSNIDFDGNKNFTIFMDYMEKGSLADLIDDEERSLCPITYDNTKRQIILVGIARGMMILHQNHIIQRDLKPENILLDFNYHPRITDFGLSKKYDPYNSMYQSITNSGTISYMAPEVINSNNYNTKADVYSFGIIVYEILTGKRVFKKFINDQKKLKKKVSKGFRPEIEEGSIKKSLKSLIEKCWSPNPRERPTADELFKKLSLSNDDYFAEFYEDNPESCIDDNDEEDDDEFSANKKYCLDGVDLDELFEYIDEISEEPTSLIDKKKTKEIKDIEEKISTLESELSNDKKLNEQMQEMTTKITSLESQLNESKDEASKIKDDNNKLNEQIQEMTEKVTSLEFQLIELKEESSEIKDENTKLNEQIQEISLKNPINESEINNHKKTVVNDRPENETKKEIERLNSQIFVQSLIISSINRTIGKISIPQKIESFIVADISQENPGLLCILKNKNENPFDRLFIASQSSNDICNLMIKSKDTFITQEKSYFFVEFHLKEAVIMNGIKIYSSSGSFPQSFDIQVNRKIVYSIKETAELSEPFKKTTIKFDSIKGEKIRFFQTGPSRDKGNNTLWLKRFEILSSESKYSNGVFTALINESEDKDPHKCPVIISASNFDLNGFYLINNKNLIYTLAKENSWFQIEFTKGFAILKGFRLRKTRSFLLKSFKIICTIDAEQPDDSWTTLIEVDEKTRDENPKTLVMEFDDASPPAKFIRIVNTGPNWSNKMNLIFHHLDFFGIYF